MPQIFYALYIGPNNDSNGHLIYKLSTSQILVAIKYQSVPIPEDLIKAVNETTIVWDNHSNINNNNNCIHFNDENNSEDESCDELDSSQQLNGMESNKIV